MVNSLYIALPVIDEISWIPLLLSSIAKQKEVNSSVALFVCVNQPESYWEEVGQQTVCENNQQVIRLLNSFEGCRVHLIDKSSRGKGWCEKKQGVGWARKLIFDAIMEEASPQDIVVSMDADTTFDTHFFSALIRHFKQKTKSVAIEIPYYHRLVDDETTNRAMLRYEIYMRNYAINMMRINNPYAFTALGSAMAFRAAAYKAIRGVAPRQSGEDFYLLQKMVKYGKITHYLSEKVYPATRISARVPFGTGPAIGAGLAHIQQQYPLYTIALFEKVARLYATFTMLYKSTNQVEVDPFFEERFGTELWEKLRRNATSEAQFIRACSEKIDGLRILQYVKYQFQNSIQITEKEVLSELLKEEEVAIDLSSLDFETSTIVVLDEIRNTMEKIELDYRKRLDQ